MNLTRVRYATAVAMLFALISSPTIGQDSDRGDRGGRPGGFGRGGFRGGMMGAGMMGGMVRSDMMLLGFLRIEEVQKEIDLLSDQKEALEKLGEKLREGSRPEAGFDFREATEEQRNEFIEKMRAWGEEQSKMVTENLEEILFPEQLERLRQIGLQQQSAQAFFDPTFVEKIGLKEEQQEKIREKQQEMFSQIGELMRSGDRESMRSKLEGVRSQLLEEAKSVLTPEQKKQYEEMLGKPFEMPANAMRGGLGRPPGGRGPRGDR